jgi:hypothetical protein
MYFQSESNSWKLEEIADANIALNRTSKLQRLKWGFKMSSSRWWAVFLGVATVEIALLVKVLTDEATIELLVALAVVTILLLVAYRIEDLIEILVSKDKFKFEAKLYKKIDQKVEDEVKGLERRLEARAIYEALRRSLTKHEYAHLVEFAKKKPIPDCRCNDFLLHEMIRLCQHGYIEETPFGSTVTMSRETGEFDLAEFYKITPEGEKFLQMLQELEPFVTG